MRLMFHHLDANSDGILSEEELYQIEHDKVCQTWHLENGKLEASLNYHTMMWMATFSLSITENGKSMATP